MTLCTIPNSWEWKIKFLDNQTKHEPSFTEVTLLPLWATFKSLIEHRNIANPRIPARGCRVPGKLARKFQMGQMHWFRKRRLEATNVTMKFCWNIAKPSSQKYFSFSTHFDINSLINQCKGGSIGLKSTIQTLTNYKRIPTWTAYRKLSRGKWEFVGKIESIEIQITRYILLLLLMSSILII